MQALISYLFSFDGYIERYWAALMISPPGLRYGTTVYFGLWMGSFITLVSHRLPIMMENAWQTMAREQFGTQTGYVASLPARRFNLAWPRSECPHCGHKLHIWENIPILSYLFLRGRCGSCRAPIGLRYPLIECASVGLAVACPLTFGWNVHALVSYVLCASLLTLSVIDAEQAILPDVITLGVLWTALVLDVMGMLVLPRDAVLGAVAGYVTFLPAAKRGWLGYGDLKLFAALGAWFGWQALPTIMAASMALFAVCGGAWILLKRLPRNTGMPLGPYIAVVATSVLFHWIPCDLLYPYR